uniref:Ig-like domain-containing protein n=1 Tax=Neogobius melanostomus TaxID=47308 RepID=A0A8C6U6M4_9GOBI
MVKCMFLCLLCHLCCCSAGLRRGQSADRGQAGPLYRVEGSPLSISCSVSGLPPLPDGRNNFEFRVKKPSKPNLVSHVISTESSDFAYAAYGQRVKAGEIMVEHVDQNSVLFKILRLEKTDEGEYECAVINTRGTFYGTYSAMTTVKGRPNLHNFVSMSPASLTQTEGDSVDFTCEVSSNTVQHTHLSFAWFLGANTEAAGRPLISMDKDFRLIPGPGFEERYKAGLIRLDKIGEVTYKLKMSHLELSDQGALYCEAQEWIQDPDRTWYSIAKKAAEKTILTVLSDSESLVVTVSVPQSNLQEGQRLTVSCAVDTQNLKEKFFSLAWLRGGVELARVGPTGVLTVGPDYSSREREGELRAARIGERDYSLILQPVRTSDQGAYVCRAWPEERSSTGDFTQGAYQDSAPHAVAISATESGLQVEMANNKSVKEGNKLELSCRVSGVTGQLSVTWQRQSASNPSFSDLIRLDQDGVMAKAEGSLDVSVRALRPAPDLFSLELEEATQADDGVYQCVVSEWKTNNKASSQVATSTVSVTSLVSLTGRYNQAAEGQEVELICRVKGLSLPRTLTWSIRRDSPTPDTILTLYSSGAISWFGDQQQRYQLKIENKNPQQNEMWYHLIIKSASKSEAGKYQCSVSVVLEQAPRKLSPSNELAVSVERPKSDLILTMAPSIRANTNADIELKCSVSSSLLMSRYAVTWLLGKQAENKMIVRSDQDAFLTFGPEVEPSLRQRLSVTRTEGPSFILTIRNARSSDIGVYMCEVVQWQLDTSQQWHQFPLSPKAHSDDVELTCSLFSEVNNTEFNISTAQSLTIPCTISAQSSHRSEFQITWLWQKDNGTKQRPLFTAYRNSTLQYWSGKNDEQLRFNHPLPNQFILTMPTPSPADSGMYFCEVEEWVPTPSRGWRKVGVETSGYVTAHVYMEGKKIVVDSKYTEQPFVGVTFLLLLVILLLVLRICRGNNLGKKKEATLWTENHQLNPKD